MYLINAPSFVAKMWSMVQKVLDPTVAAKIHISADIPREAFSQLLEDDVLPIEFGGNNPMRF